MSESVALALVDELPDAVVIMSLDGCLRAANTAAERNFGWSRSEWQGRSLLELVHPDDLDWALVSLDSVAGKDIGTTIELRVRAADGWRLVEILGRPFEHAADKLVAIVVRDLTRRRRWEIAGDDTELFREVMKNADGLTIVTSRAGTVTAASAALVRLTGIDPADAIGRPVVDLSIDEDRSRVGHRLQALVASGASRITLELRLRTQGRPPVPCLLTVVNLADDPVVRGLVISGQDITQLVEARQKLQHVARHDALTKLPNRAELFRLLDAHLTSGSTTGALAFVDLDHFKAINDLYGHDVGDELLTQVADRLARELRPSDTAARFGGDEFIIIISTDDKPDLDAVTERLRTILGREYDLSVGTVTLSASIGVVPIDRGTDVDTLIAAADAAMYVAKHDGRPDRPAGRTIATSRTLAAELTDAVDSDQFELHYQPIVHLDTTRIVAAEALLRWNHPQRGLLSPTEFLDIADAVGLMPALGRHVVAKACADLQLLTSNEACDIGLAINATSAELKQDQYTTYLEHRLSERSLNPAKVTIEISERSVINSSGPAGRQLTATLNQLADLGVHLAVDDFGTGYSSLTHLVSLPVDTVKIDRTFVDGIVGDRQRRSVIAGIVGLTKSAGMQLIAEGVERTDQAAILHQLGCHHAQGYLFSPPVTMPELRTLISSPSPAPFTTATAGTGI